MKSGSSGFSGSLSFRRPFSTFALHVGIPPFVAATVFFTVVVFVGATSVTAAPSLKIHGQAWSEAGSIAHATDTLLLNTNGNRMQGMGGQFTAVASLGDHLEAAAGFGGTQVYHSLGDRNTEINTLGTFRNHITEARLTWFTGARENPKFSFTLGNFAYNYNRNVRNLGLYLLRGPVYPGFLVSGFGNIHTDSTRGNISGARFHHAAGNFEHDLILSQEREVPPSLDWSLAYVARYRPVRGLEIGGGVNFYHLIPNNANLTGLSRDEFPGLYGHDLATMSDSTHHPYDLRYIEVMPSGDTVFYTHQGVKVMAMFNLDLKPWLGAKRMGPDDMRLYGEAAVIGIQDYGSVYDNILERIPVMVGFNVPTWGILDVLSLEVEWYGAKYRADYSKLGLFNSAYHRGISPTIPTYQPPLPSPIPVSYRDYDIDSEGNTPSGDNVTGTGMDVQNMTTDDWKWSLFAQKTFARRFRFTGQIANDHFVPRPARAAIFERGGLAEAFSSLKDWYFMFRAGYHF